MNTALLLEIRRLILEEPLRLNMRDWSSGITNAPVRPACDTVACIAGWAVAIDRGGPDLSTATDVLTGYFGDFEYDARCLLELTREQALRLFFVGFWPAQFRAATHTYKHNVHISDTPSQDEIDAGYAEVFTSAPDPATYLCPHKVAGWPVAVNLQPQTVEYAQLVARRIDHFIATDGAE